MLDLKLVDEWSKKGFSLLQALAKTLTVPQLAYLRDQFALLGPNKSGFISMQNFKTVSSFLKLIVCYFGIVWSYIK